MANVLVADDETDIRDLIALKLDREGHTVRTAPDGQIALEMARAWLPDLVLLDWVMPGIPGPEVCRLLRAERATAHLGVILVTARAARDDVHVGLAAGADDYLVKPFRLSELNARVGAFTTGDPAQRAAAYGRLALGAAAQLVTAA